MAKKDKFVESIDKDSVRDKRARNAEHKANKKTNDGKKFDRRRARQRDSEKSREEDYFYN